MSGFCCIFATVYREKLQTSMTHYQPSSLPNTRIDAADLLRAVAVGGIILVHFLEHLNFYSFPPLTKFDEAVWDVVFFLLSNRSDAVRAA